MGLGGSVFPRCVLRVFSCEFVVLLFWQSKFTVSIIYIYIYLFSVFFSCAPRNMFAGLLPWAQVHPRHASQYVCGAVAKEPHSLRRWDGSSHLSPPHREEAVT